MLRTADSDGQTFDKTLIYMFVNWLPGLDSSRAPCTWGTIKWLIIVIDIPELTVYRANRNELRSFHIPQRHFVPFEGEV
jgi:hypothetical protein